MISILYIFLKKRVVAISFGITLFAHAIGSSLSAQVLETERWSLPLKVDREHVPTDMMVEFSFERIDVPFVEFNPGTDTDRVAMDSFVQTVVGGDIESALDLTAVPQGETREKNRNLIQEFSQMLKQAEAINTLQLEKVVHVGPDRTLLWSIPINDGQRYYRSFRFIRNEQSQLQYAGVDIDPMSSLITYATQIGQATGPDRRESSEFEYSYVFPGTHERPVHFRFNGVEIEVDAFNPLGETGNRVIDFFNESMTVLANGTAEEFATYYSSFSEGRYKDWAIDQGSEAYEAYRSDMVRHGARVVFLLNADPIYVLFYLPTDIAIQGSPLSYTSLYDNPETGFELTNFYNFGLVDGVLQRREYFEEPFLRPLLKEAGLIPKQFEQVRTVIPVGEEIVPDSQEIISNSEFLAQFEGEKSQADIAGIEDIAKDNRVWMWSLGGAVLIVLTIIILRRRQ